MSGEPQLIRRRMRYERDFTQLPNKWLRDERLTFRARGLLAMLMTHEAGWRVTLKAIAASSPGEGVDAIRTAVGELEAYGYLVRHPVQQRGRFVGDHWELVDPFELGEPLWRTALDNPTRPATALDHPTRTALDDPTPIEDKKNTKVSLRGTLRGRGPACGEPTAARAAHVYVDRHASTCEACGTSRDGTYRVDVLTGARIE